MEGRSKKCLVFKVVWDTSKMVCQCSHKGTQRGVGKQFIILTGPRETVPPNATREPAAQGEGISREGAQPGGWKPRESEDPRVAPLLGVRVEYTRKGMRGFHRCV